MKKDPQKNQRGTLKLSKETVRLLESGDLLHVNGGESRVSFCPGTREGCCQLN